jgi:hypothetical protein
MLSRVRAPSNPLVVVWESLAVVLPFVFLNNGVQPRLRSLGKMSVLRIKYDMVRLKLGKERW